MDGIKRSSETKANLPLRGIGEQGATLRKGITIAEGRMFNRGANEVVVGKALLKEFAGFELGKRITFATSRWTVVGIFEAEGGVFEGQSGPICRWCRACSIGRTSSRPCGRGWKARKH